MMTQNLSLPPHLVATLHQLAQDRDVSFDHLVRGMLDREVMRLRSADASQRMRVQRLARLQQLLAPVFDAARTWEDLQARLALIGFELRPDRHAITLHDRATGEWICRGTDLGIAYPLLVRRFGTTLPTQPDRVSSSATKKAAGAEPDDLIDLFEAV